MGSSTFPLRLGALPGSAARSLSTTKSLKAPDYGEAASSRPRSQSTDFNGFGASQRSNAGPTQRSSTVPARPDIRDGYAGIEYKAPGSFGFEVHTRTGIQWRGPSSDAYRTSSHPSSSRPPQSSSSSPWQPFADRPSNGNADAAGMLRDGLRPPGQPRPKGPPIGRRARELQLAEMKQARVVQDALRQQSAARRAALDRKTFEQRRPPERRPQERRGAPPAQQVRSTARQPRSERPAEAAAAEAAKPTIEEVEEEDALIEMATESPARLAAAQRRQRKAADDELMQAKIEASKAVKQKADARLQEQRVHQHKAKTTDDSAARRVELPTTIVAGNLSRLLNTLALIDVRQDMLELLTLAVLSSEDAALVVMELGFDPVVDDDAAFDLFPAPPHPEPSTLPARPPIVCIMGHVDHGKTSLLDALRSSSVAAGEAGGITQHIGAFEVPIKALYTGAGREAPSTATGKITFLDTPGHAAFTAMRSRGANVTDIVILVVAADDGVRPQTEEVISLITGDRQVGIVVAITKCDKPDVDLPRVKQELADAGIVVEDLGGDVPCVEVSSTQKLGLDSLVETLSTVAEVRELTAEQEGVRVEGRVIESHVEKGRGNVATVLVTRGQLAVGQIVVAGLARCKVRQLTPAAGKAVKTALPGQPVEITGWKELPMAGDEVLQAEDEAEARRAVDGRARRVERQKLLADVEVINSKARADAEAHNLIAQKKAAIAKAKREGAYVPREMIDELEEAVETRTEQAEATVVNEHGERVKPPEELLLLIRADFQGTLEAVCGALEAIGNKEARVKIVSSGVGEISDGDIATAKSIGGTVIGFNVKPTRAITDAANKAAVPLLCDKVIYRLIDGVTDRVTALLPKIFDTHVQGEAVVQQIFEITLSGRTRRIVAGCRVDNGTISRSGRCRVMRGSETVHEGQLDTLRSFKKDVTTAPKGAECGLSFENWAGFQEGDRVQTVEQVARKRSL